jgi:Co/Zn/Cd efflux system component
LIAIAIGIVLEAWRRLTAAAPPAVDAGVMSGVAVGPWPISGSSSSCAAPPPTTERAGTVAHVIGDLLASVAVVGGGLVVGHRLLSPDPI